MENAIVGLIYNSEVQSYPEKSPFNPPKQYKELEKFNFKIDPKNIIYDLFRKLLLYLKLDKKNINSKDWNPFSEFVKKDDIVLIKPNFVKHFHSLGYTGILSQITHGSILRPIIDYVILALNNTGRIIIADTPLDKADFNRIIKLNQTKNLIQFYDSYLGQKIELYDLRSYTLKKTRINYDKKKRIKLPGPPKGYIKINLKDHSELCEIDKDTSDYFTLADSTIEKYDIRTKRKSKTNDYHYKNTHIYKIPKLILESNVIISVPKLKTHRMAGVTLNLKNMIGICEKIYLPHHRRGSPPIGDAYPSDPSIGDITKRKMIHKYTTISKQLSNILEKIKNISFFKKYIYPYYQKLINKVIIEEDWWGAWYGNDTLWRTIYDLNKIIFYADRNGNLQEKPQRKYFSIIDGIIGQEGEGPMTGIPRPCGLIIGGVDPVACDTVASYLMGYDINKLKIIKNAKDMKSHKLGTCDLNKIKILSNIENPLKINLKFILPKGYKNLSR
ncbi:MAG: DUF362 domain-containing protein [Promethearchaeota archaeon]